MVRNETPEVLGCQMTSHEYVYNPNTTQRYCSSTQIVSWRNIQHNELNVFCTHNVWWTTPTPTCFGASTSQLSRRIIPLTTRYSVILAQLVTLGLSTSSEYKIICFEMICIEMRKISVFHWCSFSRLIIANKMILKVKVFGPGMMLRITSYRYSGLIVGVNQSWFVNFSEFKGVE